MNFLVKGRSRFSLGPCSLLETVAAPVTINAALGNCCPNDAMKGMLPPRPIAQ